MFTSVDKAAAAVILGALSLCNYFGVTDVSPDTASNINAVIALATPILVWLIPNKSSGSKN